MCGIIGYIGKREAFPVLISGLKRMEYRGYDSFGFCIHGRDKNFSTFKKVGKISGAGRELDEMTINGNIGHAHTRWATHGGVTEVNAHPHLDCAGAISVVHNGIIENYKELKKELEAEGHAFLSQTDTEVLAHLVEKYFDGNLERAVKKAVARVRGTYGLVVIAKNDPNKIVAARSGSPLLIGIGEDEFLVASDPAAVVANTKKVVYLNEGEIATLTADGYSIYAERQPQEIEWDLKDVEKGDYPHFMLKEIMEQPESLANSLRGRLLPDEGSAKLGGLMPVGERLREIKKLHIVACGTARYAGLIGELMLEEYADLPTDADAASEFRYRKNILERDSAVLAISQSGETADTLAAIREAKSKGILTIGITNAVESTQARETDAGIYNHAGPEIGVASSKAFTSQLTVLALLTLYLGRQRNMALVMGQRIVNELAKIPSLAQETIENCVNLKEIAQIYKNYSSFFFMGRKYNFPIAMEGALKLKELAYVHAEGVASGELKHGMIALIDNDYPVIVICPSDSVYEKNISNIMELKARGARILAVATEGNEEIAEIANEVVYIPKTLEMLTPILTAIVMQLFSYHVAFARGCDIDKPRNLAKSVTVE
ncbi:MAG: glutamine--fructose-6-phosphate transaminase (isomerizing) [Candidatus Nealsonbacteria bacterium DGGOD1a]|nr:MAG: glutamine--fructose-6-phosphate transaminase (isomerizing) [Candidatus Nealsonbacteria bacterium DGGOD1a]